MVIKTAQNKRDYIKLLLLADEQEDYDHPIFEAGKQLVDKIYLRKEI